MGVAVCFALCIVAMLVGLGGYSGFIPAYTAYLCPSSLVFVRDFQSHPVIFWLVLAMSVGANALLYGILFVVVRRLVHLLRRPNSDV